MKSEKDNKEKIAFTIEVEKEVIEDVRKGNIRRLVLGINDDNYRQILENYNGHLILCVEDLPNTYHGCYFYNNGEFPYIINTQLEYLVLTADDDHCITKILDTDTEPGVRFRFQGNESIEDPNGNSCIWEVGFEVVPLLKEPRKYLMRWNPSISSFTEQDYEAALENMKNGMFFMDWSIHEWEEARRGDIFYMMRVDDDKAGIVFSGLLLSDPYVSDDWAGSSKRRLYVDLACMNPVEPGEVPHISLEKLMTAIPDFDWQKGHSGELLPVEVTEKLNELWEEVD